MWPAAARKPDTFATFLTSSSSFGKAARLGAGGGGFKKKSETGGGLFKASEAEEVLV